MHFAINLDLLQASLYFGTDSCYSVIGATRNVNAHCSQEKYHTVNVKRSGLGCLVGMAGRTRGWGFFFISLFLFQQGVF